MRVVLFCHSLLSDYNHGNAHFLRGVVTELAARGHEVSVYEPEDAWSVHCLVADRGEGPLADVRRFYPAVRPIRYRADDLDLDRALDGASLVLVHEWSEPELVRRIGEHRARGGDALLFFHDTHHRSVTDPEAMGRYELGHYDAVLAFGRIIRDIYLARGWAKRAFVWHEAADARVFSPRAVRPERDLVWIGNFGDEERTAELEEFLLRPVRELGLSARVHGVRYPESARAALSRSGIEYAGWLPNYLAPGAFARARVTVHVPRRPYASRLVGIPTIRPFEALACGIPLVSAPWEDAEGLFSPGRDYLVARDGDEMKRHLRFLLDHPEAAAAMAARGRATILARHTAAHRVDELLAIRETLEMERGRWHAAHSMETHVGNEP
ncbi:Glycosyltransferase [Minicystis rosea]|nr:Glycosyltransferase [Minicystis rosea]